MSDPDCFVCAKHAAGSDVVGGVIYEDEVAYVGHLLPPQIQNTYLGYLMVEPKRHVTGWGELTDDEAEAMGRLVNRAGRSLKESEGAEHIYSVVMGDAVPHLHIHVIPRYPGTPREFWGHRVGEWPDAPRGGAEAIEAICRRLRHRF